MSVVEGRVGCQEGEWVGAEGRVGCQEGEWVGAEGRVGCQEGEWVGARGESWMSRGGVGRCWNVDRVCYKCGVLLCTWL